MWTHTHTHTHTDEKGKILQWGTQVFHTRTIKALGFNPLIVTPLRIFLSSRFVESCGSEILKSLSNEYVTEVY